MRGYNRLVLCLSLLAIHASVSAATVSKRLNDVIESRGIGNINVMDIAGSQPDLTGAELEAFRLDNGGRLVFAIDVNEAANGTEKASSQGVAIENLELIVESAGVTHVFTDFWSQSQSMLAPKGEQQRQLRYTLIGDTGSSRITPNTDSDIYGSDFDATVYVPVDIDLTGAASVTLNIQFMDTQVQLGDPEAFYDYSNGYEDIAIISAEDAAFLDQLQAGWLEAPLVIRPGDSDLTMASAQYFPSANQYYIVAFEDCYPERGDYDFNDLVVAYRVNAGFNKYGKAVQIFGEGFLIAKGAEYDLDWGLSFNLGAISGAATTQVLSPETGVAIEEESLATTVSGQTDLPLFTAIKSLWSPIAGAQFINTEPAQPIIQGPGFTFTIALDTPMEAFSPDAFRPYLYVRPNFQTVYAGMDFVNDQGYPFGLILPDTWSPPTERTDMGLAYTDLIDYIESDGAAALNWHANKNPAQVMTIPRSSWQWR
ncbi:LruC domain-containing protein [Hahella sp. CR1]|uniref:LruC domain-containing protein n=1 Tax=Hahella sp. CR1 TaxID=2992807 RepID=UPI002442B199|nr:LruC domain-containing protein [Hahella sp. CR1]MDG9666307.1 LruC domain-containing protein [Hahella sp. CR1]